MSEIREMTRREFSLEAALAVLSGVAITISGCGGSSSPTSPSGPPSASGDKVGAISANHGHSAVITSAKLAAGAGFALDIRGTATHTHSVTLSDADIQAIGGGQRVSHASSTNDGHDHTVTFN